MSSNIIALKSSFISLLLWSRFEWILFPIVFHFIKVFSEIYGSNSGFTFVQLVGSNLIHTCMYGIFFKWQTLLCHTFQVWWASGLTSSTQPYMDERIYLDRWLCVLFVSLCVLFSDWTPPLLSLLWHPYWETIFFSNKIELLCYIIMKLFLLLYQA